MIRPTNLLNILAAVLVIEASAFTAFLIVHDVQYSAQVNTAPHCGNSVIEAHNGEECDNGRFNGLDGECSSTCQREVDDNSNGNSSGGGSSQGSGDAYCGDSVVQSNEECDEGASNGLRGSTCSVCCILKPLGQVRDSDDDDDENACSCGNGKKEWPEQCDAGDGNGARGSECSRFCKEIDLCGNGQEDNDEECDDGNADNADGCTNTCKLPICGDGTAQFSNNEECDDGNSNDNDGCSQDCKKERCGDYIKQTNEECDEGDDQNEDQNECTSQCKKARCGDGIVQETLGEECDSGFVNGAATSKCTKSCKVRVKATQPRCGDGVVQANEECDQGELNGKNIAGVIRCTTSCVYPVKDNNDGSSSTKSTRSNTSSEGNIGSQGTTEISPVLPIDQPKDLDALRQKKNKQEKQLLEVMRKAQVQDAEIRNDSEIVDDIENNDGLHCFDAEGNVINDRSGCDRSQEQYLLVRPEVSDAQIRTELSRKLLGDNATEEKRAHLVESLQKARARLEKMYASGNYEGEVQEYFEESIGWLERGIAYFSSGDRTREEIQQMAEPVRQLVEQASGLVQQKLNLPSNQPDINPIVEKTEKLVLKFRESFIALAQAKIALDRNALEQYTEAANLFANVKRLCLEDSEQCTRIHAVLDILKEVQGPLQKQLEQNPDVYKRVQEQFEQ